MTEVDLVTDHPFMPSRDWPDTCAYQHAGYYGWMCVYSRAEHAAAEGDPEEATADAWEQPTDQDLVTDHPFLPHPFDPDACAWDEVLRPCGYSRKEHASPGAADSEDDS